MKKAVVIMNGTLVSQYIITSSVALAKFSKSALHACFLVHDASAVQFDYLFPNDLSLTQNRLTGKSIAEENADLVNAYKQLFIDECTKEGVSYTIEGDSYMALKELIKRSVFSDFIIADAKANLDQYRLADLLADVHCPVVLVSEMMSRFNKVVLTYDGSDSSMYAMKMFRYLFPEWSEAATELLFVSENKGAELPFNGEIKSWLSGHFKNIKITIAQGSVQEQLLPLLKGNEPPLVVMGAYGRSNLSRLFHRSLADSIINKTNASLFVIHE